LPEGIFYGSMSLLRKRIFYSKYLPSKQEFALQIASELITINQ
jgi:hypothetical protein